jgi:GT2 family glycosyltransferase
VAAPKIVPVSAIIPTRNRAETLTCFLNSLASQDPLPAEIVICDASDDDTTLTRAVAMQTAWAQTSAANVRWTVQRATQVGLAPQRNQAVAAAHEPLVWFLDDDIVLEPGCLHHLHEALTATPHLGGVTATLVNEPYHPPGRLTLALMRWFENGHQRSSYASSCIGPGWTFLPDGTLPAPPLRSAEWLGGGCTLYRKAALPTPAVPAHFEAGALGEDLAASLTVGLHWQLGHAPAARAIHNSQGGDHKSSMLRRADQSLRNRYYIMTRIMGKVTLRDHFDFALMHLFTLASLLRRRHTWPALLPTTAGYCQALFKLFTK